MSECEYFGEFHDLSTVNEGEYLQLCFQPSSIPLKQRWRNNGLSADFLADYVSTFFPNDVADPKREARRLEIKDSVSYIANELLENGMKYAGSSLDEAMRINMVLKDEAIIFNETNAVNNEQAATFKAFINRLQNSDPMDMFVEQLEAQAMNESGSGLGYLTMINDHQAELSWRFVSHKKDDIVTITTAVKLPI